MEDGLREALDGKGLSDISDFAAAEISGDRTLASKLFETYVPFRFTLDGNVVGVTRRLRRQNQTAARAGRLALRAPRTRAGDGVRAP